MTQGASPRKTKEGNTLLHGVPSRMDHSVGLSQYQPKDSTRREYHGTIDDIGILGHNSVHAQESLQLLASTEDNMTNVPLRWHQAVRVRPRGPALTAGVD